MYFFFRFVNGTFADEATSPTDIDSGTNAIALGEFNNDRCFDIVVANY
jgi:hypothetical protein